MSNNKELTKNELLNAVLETFSNNFSIKEIDFDFDNESIALSIDDYRVFINTACYVFNIKNNGVYTYNAFETKLIELLLKNSISN